MSTRRPKVPRAGYPAGSGPTAPEPGAGEAGTAGQGAAGPNSREPAAAGPNSREPGAAGPNSREPGGLARADHGGAVRPGSRRPVIGRVDESPVPARSFSGRLLALAVVLVTIIVLLAPSVRTYLQQRADISSLQAQIDGDQATKTKLTKEISRWDDPAYVKQQARDRYFMVMPGETSYLVIGAKEHEQKAQDKSAPAEPQDQPWAEALWTSMQRVGTE